MATSRTRPTRVNPNQYGLADHTYEAIAKRLNREGYRSAHGKTFTRANVGMLLRPRGQGRRTSEGSKPENAR